MEREWFIIIAAIVGGTIGIVGSLGVTIYHDVTLEKQTALVFYEDLSLIKSDLEALLIHDNDRLGNHVVCDSHAGYVSGVIKFPDIYIFDIYDENGLFYSNRMDIGRLPPVLSVSVFTTYERISFTQTILSRFNNVDVYYREAAVNSSYSNEIRTKLWGQVVCSARVANSFIPDLASDLKNEAIPLN